MIACLIPLLSPAPSLLSSSASCPANKPFFLPKNFGEGEGEWEGEGGREGREREGEREREREGGREGGRGRELEKEKIVVCFTYLQAEPAALHSRLIQGFPVFLVLPLRLGRVRVAVLLRVVVETLWARLLGRTFGCAAAQAQHQTASTPSRCCRL